LKYLQVIGQAQLSQLMENAKYVMDGNERISIVKDGTVIATLEIENDFYYLKTEDQRIKLGVVRPEDDKQDI